MPTYPAAQFHGYLQKGRVPAVSLWLGQETYWRDRCRRAVLHAKLPGELREQGYERQDLAELSLSQVLDDARAMSLFAIERVIYVVGAEAAMPRVVTDDSADPALAAYCQDPTPGVTLVLDCSRYGFEGDDKPRIARLKKFYAAVPIVVEFEKPDLAQSRALAESLVAQNGLRLAPGALELMLEATAGEPARLANEIEKLALSVGEGGEVSVALVADLLPNARSSDIFELVAAIGAGRTMAAFAILDTLARDGEYLPLALSFLGTQFRLALAAEQAGLRSASDIMRHFRNLGVAIWPSRAEQVANTLKSFSGGRLATAIQRTFEADRNLRDARPEDRVVLENYLLQLRSGAGSASSGRS